MANKFVFYARPGTRIPLGKQGEKNHLEVHFNISKWRQTFGDGVVDLIARRCGDAEAYPVTFIVSEMDTVIWTVADVDTAQPGFGSVELQYYVNDTVAKSETFSTVVAPSLDPTGDPPDPYESWLQQLIAAGFGNLPDGGTEGQALVKLSDKDRDVGWKTVKGGGDITTDPTLTIEGQAADAKVVGDALAGKASIKLIIQAEQTGYDEYSAYISGQRFMDAVNAGREVELRFQGESYPMRSYSFAVSDSTTETYLVRAVFAAFDPETMRQTALSLRGYNTSVNLPMTVTSEQKAYTKEESNELFAETIPVPPAAEVGQTIVVSAVDENGKPTAWDVADMASGGGEPWELMNFAEFTEECTAISFSEDSQGNPLNLKKALLLGFYPKYEGDTALPSYCFAERNHGIVANDATLAYTGLSVPSASQPRSFQWLCEWDGVLYRETYSKTETSANEGKPGGSNNHTTYYNTSAVRTLQLANTTQIGLYGTLLFEGCKFWLYGVRA